MEISGINSVPGDNPDQVVHGWCGFSDAHNHSLPAQRRGPRSGDESQEAADLSTTLADHCWRLLGQMGWCLSQPCLCFGILAQTEGKATPPTQPASGRHHAERLSQTFDPGVAAQSPPISTTVPFDLPVCWCAKRLLFLVPAAKQKEGSHCLPGPLMSAEQPHLALASMHLL